MRGSEGQSLYQYWLSQIKTCEDQLSLEIPRLATRVTDYGLKALLLECAHRTDRHSRCADDLFANLETDCDAGICIGMVSLIRENNLYLHDIKPGAILDYAILEAVQKLAFYKIASYGSTLSLARLLGRKRDEIVLKEVLLDQYEATDDLTAFGDVLLVTLERLVSNDVFEWRS